MISLGLSDIGFVPTMGAFHEGHLSLMRVARSAHETVVVSLFVNPLQFAPGEDLSRYPRQEERDGALAQREGVDVLFAPTPDEIYPRRSTTIHVPELTVLWEGASRPGHFDGVTTVVAKLFNIVRPRTAYFGWKDLQQCLVIQRMVEDLNFPVQLEFRDTVREQDGLALSSRNAYLSPLERSLAPWLYRSLQAISIGASGPNADIDRLIHVAQGDLKEKGFAVDYLEVVSLIDLEPTRARGPVAVIGAARLGTTRLIDNLRFTID